MIKLNEIKKVYPGLEEHFFEIDIQNLMFNEKKIDDYFTIATKKPDKQKEFIGLKRSKQLKKSNFEVFAAGHKIYKYFLNQHDDNVPEPDLIWSYGTKKDFACMLSNIDLATFIENLREFESYYITEFGKTYIQYWGIGISIFPSLIF